MTTQLLIPQARPPVELAYAEIATNFVAPNTNENDITGLVDIPVVAGVLPFFIEFYGPIVNATSAQGHQVKMYRKTGAGAYALVFNGYIMAGLNNAVTIWQPYRKRQVGLTPGVEYQYKVTLDTVNTGTLTVLGASTSPAYFRAFESGLG